MKKFIILICLILPLALFAACGDEVQTPVQTDPAPTNQGIVIDAGNAVTIGVNETRQLTAYSKKDNSKTTVIWSSDNTSVVTVDYNGMLTGISDGTATITATTPDESFSASCQVTVSSVLTNIAFESASLTLEKGSETQLNLILTPSNVTNVALTWMSGDPNVVTVSNGVVTAVGDGTTSIYVSDIDNKFTAACTVTVVTTVTGVKLDVEAFTIQMNKGDTRQLIASIIPADSTNQHLTWESSDPNVIEVSQDGTIVAKSGGAANITVTSDNGKSDTCNIVVNSPVESITLDHTEVVIGVGETLQLIATIIPEDASQQDISWGCEDLSVVTVDNTGALIGMSTGVVKVTATTVDGYFVAECIVTVINAATEITFEYPAGDLEIGKTMQLIPILTPENADAPILTWVSSNPDVASVDETGKITALTLGETVITATATNGVTATYTLRVVAVEIRIEQIVIEDIYFAKVANTFQIGVSLVPTNCTEGYVITSYDPTIVRVNADGSLTPLKDGVATIIVSSKSGAVTATCLVSVDPLTDDEFAALLDEYQQKENALLNEHQENINKINTKYDAQIAKLDEIIAKLSISSEEEYHSKRADLSTRLEDAQKSLDQYIAEGNQELIAVYTATKNELQTQINNLDNDWTKLSMLFKNKSNSLTAQANELANEDSRYATALNKLKAEYAFLF